MKYGRFLLAMAAGVWLAIAPAHACGRERWAAKVLADGLPLLPTPVVSDVAALRALPRPFGVDGFDSPRVRAERKVYRVQGELLGFKLEQDGDIHAVIAEDGDRSQTLIAEIPDPRCMAGAPSGYVNDVVNARLAFVKQYGIPPVRTFRLSYQPIVVTGALFFDFGHEQNGAAPNQAELHPVLAIGNSTLTPSLTARRTMLTQVRDTSECAGDVRVWVNTKSGVYHLPGSRWYGNTRRGEFLCKRQADEAGYRAALKNE